MAPGPLRLLILLVGLCLFGSGEACIVAAELGNSPWTVLAQGVAEHTPLEIGAATVVISLLVLAAWIPLRQPPGLGTVLNAIVVGVAIGVMVNLLPADPGPAVAWPLLAGGIGLVGLGGGVYLGPRLGPGPRDGLMTGLRPHRALATANAHDHELTALLAGYALGGAVGIGTAAFARLIGPAVQAALEAAAPRMRGLG